MRSLALMTYGERRFLTEDERAALSPGLAAALAACGCQPVIVARASVFALIARLWRRRVPVMVIGRRIFWPGAALDFTTANARTLSLLQHELQHVLEFRTGVLSALGYILLPFNWRYGYRLDAASVWGGYGAEQRAQIVQDYFLAARGLLPSAPSLETYRQVIPWAV